MCVDRHDGGDAAVGTAWLIDRLQRRAARRITDHRRIDTVRVLCFATTVLLILVVGEVVVWAAAYRTLSDSAGIRTWEDAVYFSAVTFPSLGYGDVVLTDRWRLLSAIEAIDGLMIFGWSTALLFAVLSRCWEAESVADREVGRERQNDGGQND